MFKQIFQQKVVEVFFANWGHFGKQGTPEYYIRGYVTIYSNRYKTVMGGGGASGVDYKHSSARYYVTAKDLYYSEDGGCHVIVKAKQPK